MYADPGMRARDFSAMKTVLACLLFVFYRQKVFTDDWKPPERIVGMLASCGLAMLSSFALLSMARINSVTIGGFIELGIRDFGFTGIISTALLSVFYKRTLFSGKWEPRLRVSTLIFSSVLSLCMLLGASYQALGSWSFLLYNAFQAAWCSILFLGYVPFFYVVIETAFGWFERAISRFKAGGSALDRPAGVREKGNAGALGKACDFLLDRRPFLIPFAFFLIAWLPYWIACFPGSTQWDYLVQMLQYFGQLPFSDAHPVATTLLLGWLLNLGRTLLNDSLGLFICVLFQQLLTAGVCAYAMKTIKAWGAPGAVRGCALALLAFHPVIAFMVQTALKDTLSTALLFAFGLLYIDLLRNIRLGRPLAKKLAAAALAAILASLIRHNNIYVTALSMAALPFIRQAAARRLLLACAALACFFAARFISGALAASLGAGPVSMKESLSIPFQQTARYLRDYGGDVTPQEREAISAVLDYDALAKAYNPELSDPVKNTYTGKNEALPAYFRAWGAMLLRHPGVYIQAMLNNCYSYFCPSGQLNVRPLVYNTLENAPGQLRPVFFRFTGVSNEDRSAIYAVLRDMREQPIIGLFLNVGCVTWMILALALWLFRKKRYDYLLGFIPALVIFFCCIASPVNGYWRYYAPILMMLPLLFAWTACGACSGDRRS